MKKIFNKSGEGYIDTCVGVVAFVMVLVVAINVFSFITLKQDMDEIADELIETASFTGCFGSEFRFRAVELRNMYFPFTMSIGAEEYYNATYKRVQLGDTMYVTISVQTYVKGLGVFQIPVTLTVTKSQVSEKYWK